MTGEYARVDELPWGNPEGRAVAELRAVPGARVAGEHLHPDWWDEADADAIVRVEVTPGERFVHMIEMLFGLAREGHVDERGMPGPLQMALLGREFSDVIVFRRPPPALQRALFGALGPVAGARGYRATYPGLSRTTEAPRPWGKKQTTRRSRELLRVMTFA